jgi:hypothetical protein
MKADRDPACFDRALRRVWIVMVVLGAAGALVALLWLGWPPALGFLAGAAASLLNFRWLHQLVGGIGPGGRRPGKRLLLLLSARYFLLGAGGYVIVKIFGLSLVAALAGLLVAVAAVILEILYELIYAGT